ncbi:MAG: hypothetical protein SGJ10_02725 [Bacteroidota bacterium]|nr:hypothetical protein [Bacteroidota bacterium]
MNQKTSPLSPEKYIRTKARSLPIIACYINSDWKEAGMANIIVVRKHNNSNLTFGIYLVDLFALGTKDALYRFNVSEDVLKDVLNNSFIVVDYLLVHNIIYGANAFAEEYGFKVCKEFALVQYILEEDIEEIELMEIEFGRDGKPFLII